MVAGDGSRPPPTGRHPGVGRVRRRRERAAASGKGSGPRSLATGAGRGPRRLELAAEERARQMPGVGQEGDEKEDDNEHASPVAAVPRRGL